MKYIYLFSFFKIDNCKNLHFDTVLLKEHGNEWTKVSKCDEIFSEVSSSLIIHIFVMHKY